MGFNLVHLIHHSSGVANLSMISLQPPLAPTKQSQFIVKYDTNGIVKMGK